MSFNGLGTFRQGQWQQFRRFILNERRDVLSRIAVIKAELDRIGFIQVAYASTTDDEGDTTVSEKRVGVTVTPTDSTLAKLVGAYTVMGGNPLDLSMFAHPDKVFINETTTYSPYPSGGQVYPQSAAPAYSGEVYQRGMPSVGTYNSAARKGGRMNLEDSDMVLFMSQAQQWVQQEIMYKRNNLEARILKLCDLREQLESELDDLMRANGDALLGMPAPFDSDRYDTALTVAQTVAIIDNIWYEVAEDGTADFATQSDNLGGYPNLLSDLDDESNAAT
jgi:hypothetical protein